MADDSANVETTPRPDPATAPVTGVTDGLQTPPVDDAPSDDELAEFREWKASQTDPVPDATVETDPSVNPVDDSDVRLSQLEYKIACLPPELFKGRAPFTNPVDDPDDPPMVNGDDPRAELPGNVHLRRPGDWNDHPWTALAEHLRSERDATV